MKTNSTKLDSSLNCNFTIEQAREVCDVVLLSEDSIGPFNENQIGLADNMPAKEALTLARDKGLKHLVQTQKYDFATELLATTEIIENNNCLFEHPISTVLSPGSINKAQDEESLIVEFEFTKAADKYSVLILMEDELSKIISNETIVGKTRTIADELFTNAVYNAPQNLVARAESTRKQLLQSARMHEGKYGKLFLAKNEKNLLIGCRDPYGSLLVDDIIKRIVNCYSQGVATTMNYSEVGGAGIGIYMTFNLSSSYYIAVNPGVETIIMCTIPLKVSNKDSLMLPKNYHFVKL